MTMTEPRPTTSTTKTTTTNGHGDDHPPTITDQIVLSTAGVATHGIASGRQVICGLLDAVDTLVVGVLDGAEELARSSTPNDILTRTITVGRDAWSTGMGSVKTAVSGV